MAVSLEPLIFDRFKGIREFNGVNYGGEISAITCDNVELVQTEIGNNTGIKTMSGNTELYNLPEGYSIKGVFASEQDNIIYRFIYAETDTKGVLFYVDINSTPQVLVDNIEKSGMCNGLTMSSSAYDVFIFTNGIEAYSVCFTTESTYGDQVKPINFTESGGTKTYKTDRLGNNIKFIAMAIWNGRLVVATDYGVRASHDNDIYTWNDDPTTEADSWYINYTEKVTALYAYTGGLFIFTDDNTDFLNANPNSSSSMLVTTAGVGCHNFNSIVKHDTYLFFYSNIQKNIYMIQNIDNGQTRPTGPLAKEVQSAFKDIKDIKLYSCIYDNKNEIWVLITDNSNKQKTYIYDYNRGEWLTRSGMTITTLCLINNTLLSALGKKVYVECTGDTYNGVYVGSLYQTCFINAGSNTNLKKQKTPLLIVLNDSYTNDFYVQLIVNGKPKKEKHIKLGKGSAGVYGSTEEQLEVTPDNQIYGSTEDTSENCAHYGEYNPYSKKVVEVSTPQTWYTLSIRILTRERGQGFYIYSMELKNMKAKLKTRGR
jgi:hypothetical protein